MLGGVQWYLWLLLAVAVIGLIFAWRKVLISSKERRQRLKKEAAIWKKDYELRQNFSVLTKEKIEEMAERIRIKEKHELLAKRGSYVVD